MLEKAMMLPEPALGHAAPEVPDQAEGALQVQLHYPVELLVRDLQDRLPDVDARRAHQYVRRPHAPDGRRDAFGIRQVQLQRVGLALPGPDLARRVVRGLAVHVGAHDARPNAASPCALASPIPLPAPTTSAVLPVRSNIEA
jgi:hypothetical protein